MTFGYREHISDLIESADEFAARLAIELRDEPDNRHQGMPSDADSRQGFAAMGSSGWIGLHWPAELGGRGLSPLATVEVEERFGYHWLPLSGYLLSVKTIGNALLGCASQAIHERFLPEIAAGRLLFCQGFSEPEAGSDLAALRTTARQEGDRFVVSGRKIWTSSAQLAAWIYLAARTDPDAARPHRGISVLVADMRSPGIEVREIPTLGGGLLCEVLLEDVEVPAEQLVGDLHGGWQVLMRTLDHERVTSEKIGVVCRVLDDLADLTGGGSPSVRLELSRLRGEVEAARLLGRRAADQLAAGRPAAAASSMAKLSISGLVGRTAELGARLLGPEALVDSGTHSAAGRLAAFTRACTGSTIAGGAAEIQRRVIARQGLGCAT